MLFFNSSLYFTLAQAYSVFDFTLNAKILLLLENASENRWTMKAKNVCQYKSAWIEKTFLNYAWTFWHRAFRGTVFSNAVIFAAVNTISVWTRLKVLTFWIRWKLHRIVHFDFSQVFVVEVTVQFQTCLSFHIFTNKLNYGLTDTHDDPLTEVNRFPSQIEPHKNFTQGNQF